MRSLTVRSRRFPAAPVFAGRIDLQMDFDSRKQITKGDQQK
jgi:hypothetical protein